MAPNPAWDARQYLKFERERTQPARDLVARLEIPDPDRMVDLGCGPGTSTAVLRARWPRAECVGLDSSPAMLEVARRSDPGVDWHVGDIGTWAPEAPFDLIFSNAALHWVPDHATLLPRLMQGLRPGGALAVQMPANTAAPYQLAAERLRQRDPWRSYLRGLPTEFGIGDLATYYALLAPRCARLDLWETRYVHVLEGAEAVVEWTSGTGLRPWLARLPDETARRAFLADYQKEVAREYPPADDGRVLFPFLRRFFVAYVGTSPTARERSGAV